jgi:hypothetical protein
MHTKVRAGEIKEAKKTRRNHTSRGADVSTSDTIGEIWGANTKMLREKDTICGKNTPIGGDYRHVW